MLINIKMPTIVVILTFMSMINFECSRDKHEKKFYNLFFSHQLILRSGSNCFSRGSVPVSLRKNIATWDFPGGQFRPPVPPPPGSAYRLHAVGGQDIYQGPNFTQTLSWAISAANACVMQGWLMEDQWGRCQLVRSSFMSSRISATLVTCILHAATANVHVASSTSFSSHLASHQTSATVSLILFFTVNSFSVMSGLVFLGDKVSCSWT